MTKRWATSLLTAFSILSGTAWADCQTDYNKAIHMLADVKQKALKQEHPDPQAFAEQFQTVVNQMAGQRCQSEIGNLVNFIKTEQQSTQTPPSGTAPTLPASGQ